MNNLLYNGSIIVILFITFCGIISTYYNNNRNSLWQLTDNNDVIQVSYDDDDDDVKRTKIKYAITKAITNSKQKQKQKQKQNHIYKLKAYNYDDSIHKIDMDMDNNNYNNNNNNNNDKSNYYNELTQKYYHDLKHVHHDDVSSSSTTTTTTTTTTTNPTFCKKISSESSSSTTTHTDTANNNNNNNNNNISKYNCLTDIYFIGTSKCATTEVNDWLSNHPLITYYKSKGESYKLGNRKEVTKNGFVKVINIDDMKNQKKYQLFNNMSNNMNNTTTTTTTTVQELTILPRIMDYTPGNVYQTIAMNGLKYLMEHHKKLERKLKIIILLREPVSRMLSQYNHKMIHMGNKDVYNMIDIEMKFLNRFEQCVKTYQKELDLGKINYFQLWTRLCSPRSIHPIYQRRKFSSGMRHCRKSLYYYQLRAWLDILPKGVDIFLADTSDIANHPLDLYMSLLEFLQLPIIDHQGVVGFQNLEAIQNFVRKPPEKRKNTHSYGFTVNDTMKAMLYERLEPYEEKMRMLVKDYHH